MKGKILKKSIALSLDFVAWRDKLPAHLRASYTTRTLQGHCKDILKQEQRRQKMNQFFNSMKENLSVDQIWDRIRWAESEANRLRGLRSREPNENDLRQASECDAKAAYWRGQLDKPEDTASNEYQFKN